MHWEVPLIFYQKISYSSKSTYYYHKNLHFAVKCTEFGHTINLALKPLYANLPLHSFWWLSKLFKEEFPKECFLKIHNPFFFSGIYTYKCIDIVPFYQSSLTNVIRRKNWKCYLYNLTHFKRDTVCHLLLGKAKRKYWMWYIAFQTLYRDTDVKKWY